MSEKLKVSVYVWCTILYLWVLTFKIEWIEKFLNWQFRMRKYTRDRKFFFYFTVVMLVIVWLTYLV